MRAVIRDGSQPGQVAFTNTQDPTPMPSDSLVTVKAFSVNRGELSLLKSRADGWHPGQDFAGIVVQAAADGSGPERGARVAGLAPQGAWAERVAVASDALSPIPADMSFQTAAALPMAGLTALRTVRLLGSVIGRRVYLSAGAGGVGTFQAQLAALAGAQVIARVRQQAAREELSASFKQVTYITELTPEMQFDAVLDSVGGTHLKQVVEHLSPAATVVLFGNGSGDPTALSLLDFMPGHEGARLLTYFSYAGQPPPARDLNVLVQLLSAGRLVAPAITCLPWERLAEGLQQFAQGRVSGKLVLALA